MKFVIQRVKEARLSISGIEKASIDGGLLVFVGLGTGDDMQISLINDGPFTIVLDSRDL